MRLASSVSPLFSVLFNAKHSQEIGLHQQQGSHRKAFRLMEEPGSLHLQPIPDLLK